jgi:hypothetical protein
VAGQIEIAYPNFAFMLARYDNHVPRRARGQITSN